MSTLLGNSEATLAKKRAASLADLLINSTRKFGMENILLLNVSKYNKKIITCTFIMLET